ncbi:MAG: hypothetical protein IPL61_26870 [Myxococcales bacterium]|nr:hypothetical protein [Myxococcales bacterium]
MSVFALSIGLAACGGSGGGDDVPAIDARTSDATGGNPDAAGGGPDAAGGGVNALGQVCTPGTCPAGNMCTGVGGVGSQTMGWCSPMCTSMGGECAAGYTGPGAPAGPAAQPVRDPCRRRARG